MSVQGDILKQSPLPLPLVISLAIIQSTVLIGVLLFIGLILSKKIGLQIPIIENYLAKQKIEINIKDTIKISILLGIVAALAIIILEFLFIKLGVRVGEQISAPVWQGVLASFYGGISEEIVMRLFFMTFIIWLLAKISKSQDKILEKNWLVWTAIILSSILFGLGHLPVTAAVTAITPLVLIRALVLNGVGGIIFGWLYWKKGLESAIIAHFCADIMLHAIFFPLVS